MINVAAVQTDLLLNNVELVEVAHEEIHLALLSLAVRVLDNVLVLLSCLIELDFQLDNLEHTGEIDVSKRPAKGATLI